MATDTTAPAGLSEEQIRAHERRKVFAELREAVRNDADYRDTYARFWADMSPHNRYGGCPCRRGNRVSVSWRLTQPSTE
jgi:hypothetical protein